MATKILLKKSVTAGVVPLVGDLDVGEIAFNTVDRKLYTKDAGLAIRRLDSAYIDDTEPSNPTAGDLWYDTTSNLLKAHNGSAFVAAGYQTLTALEDTTITSAADGEILKYNGTAWINNTLADAGIATAAQGTLATNALPKSGGALTGAVTTNSTFAGVDIAARDGVLTSTTTTANAALPKAGGAMTGDLTFGDDDKAIFGTGGASSQLQIYSDGSNSFIEDIGAGDLYIRGANLRLTDPDGNLFLYGANNSNTRLYFAGEQKLTTTATGTTINGTLNILPSNAVGSYTLPASDGTSGQVLTTNGSGAITFAATAADSTKLPLAGGALTGAVTTNSTIAGVDIATRDGVLTTTTTTANAALPKAGGAMTGNLTFGDSDKAIFGTSTVLEIYGDGQTSYIKESGTGDLKVQANRFVVQDVTGAQDFFIVSPTAGAVLSHLVQGTMVDRITTTFGGVALTGDITVTGTVDGRNIATDGTKLDDIEALADVTDATNVTAAGALMDSELTSLADVKAINQGLTTTSDVAFNDLTLAGNLIVNGTTTTVNSTEVSIGDAVILLNSDETGTPSQNAGFEVERGSSTNVSFFWNETNDAWDMGSETLQNVIIDGGTYDAP